MLEEIFEIEKVLDYNDVVFTSEIAGSYSEAFFDYNPMSAALFDINGWCRKINSKFSKIFNIRTEDIEGFDKYNILYDRGFDKKTLDKLNKVFQKNFQFHGECIYNFNKSTLFKLNSSTIRNYTWFKLRAFSIKNVNECGVFIIFEDISFKKESENLLQQQVKELKILNDIILLSNKTIESNELIKDIIEKVRDIFLFDCGSFYNIVETGKAVLKYSTRNDNDFSKYFTNINLDEFPYNEVVNSKSAYFFDNYSLINPEVAMNLSLKSLGIIPLIIKENIFGIIILFSTNRHNFTENKKKVLLSIGHELGAIFQKYNYESELKQSEARYKDIFDNSALGIYQSKSDGTLITVNPAFSRMFKFGSPEVALESINNKTIEIYINEEVRIKLFMNVDKSITGTYVMETEMKKSDKSTFVGKIIIRSVKDSNNNVSYYEGFIEDITERRTAEARMRILNTELERRVKERTILLEAANKELESFAYSVSHDLRAPLRAIDGFSLAILEDYSEVLDNTAGEYLARVRKASQRMSQLIDDILVLSRVTLTEMDKKYFNLSGLVEEIYERLEHTRTGRNIELKVMPGLVINADQRLISIALENMINNAIKFTLKKDVATIEFGVQKENGFREFFIKDNGDGFSMKYYDKLFGAFQRLHSPEEFPGTGIGLATVKRIIHRHGGSIRAHSMQGDGATFYFSIPE